MEEVVVPVKLEAEPKRSPDESTESSITYTIALDPDVPDDCGSFTISHFEGGSYEEYLTWRLTFRELRDLKGWSPKGWSPLSKDQKEIGLVLFKNASILLRGPMKRKWEHAMASVTKFNIVTFEECLNRLSDFTLPRNSARHQKNYLRTVKKPADMSIQTFIPRIVAINDLIPFMSGMDASDRVPLSSEELKLCVQRACPDSWRNAFLFERKRLGKNYEDYNLHDIEVFFTILEKGDSSKITGVSIETMDIREDPLNVTI